MADLVPIYVSLGGCRARLFSVPGGVSKPEGARGIEEGCRRLGRISTGHVEFFFVQSPGVRLADRLINDPKLRRVVAAASAFPPLLASHHVQPRLLQPEQSPRPVLSTPRYFSPVFHLIFGCVTVRSEQALPKEATVNTMVDRVDTTPSNLHRRISREVTPNKVVTLPSLHHR